MTVDLVPSTDLVPSLASRIVTVNITDAQEGEWASDQSIHFRIVGDVHVAADKRIVLGHDGVRLPLPEGRGQVRLPVWAEATGEWAVEVVPSWTPHPYYIRVPAGTGSIDLSQINPLHPVDQAIAQWLLTNATVTASEGAAWGANVSVSGGNAHFQFTFPPGGVAWERPVLPTNTDFNDIIDPGIYPVPTSTGKTNIPALISGVLRVESTGSIIMQRYLTGEAIPRVWTRRRSGSTWSTWRPETPYGISPSSGTDFDTIETLGTYQINSGSHPNQPAFQVGVLEVLPLGANLLQRFTTNETQPRMYVRRRTGAGWQSWSELRDAELTAITTRLDAIEAAPGGGGGEGESPTKYGHTVRLARARQLVGSRTSTRGQVALICDHGTVKFRDIVYPKLQALGLTCTLALNSQKMEGGALFDPSQEVDTWAQVKTWANAGIEIANHGRTHQDTDSMAVLHAEIVTGHEELEAALERPIHSWVQPAASGDLGKWFGFDDGLRWDSYANTHAGRLILDRHAVVSGQIYPRGNYVLTGEPPIGVQGFWLDRTDQIEPAKTQVTNAATEKRGLILRLHPGYIGGQNTAADIEGFLDWLADQRDEGLIDVVTFTQWALTRIQA